MADVNADDVNGSVEQTEQAQQGAAAAESSTEENKDLDLLDETDDDELEVEESEDEGDAEETEEANDDQEQQKNNAETRKEKLNEEIRELVNRKNTLKQEVEAATAQQYRAATPEELMQREGMDETKAELESIRQERAIERYNAIVTQNTTAVNEESLRVLRDFPIFDKDSDQYNADVAAEANALYLKASGLRQNEKNGLVEDVKVLPHEFYKTIATAYERGVKSAAPKAQRAAERQLATADAVGTAQRKSADKDADTKGFDEVFGD